MHTDKKGFLLEIGNRIREIRECRGLSQTDLAEKVGYKSRSSINKIELGLSDVGQTTLSKIASVLNVTPSYIIDGYDSSEPKVPLVKGISSYPRTKGVPRLGEIACGTPILAVANYDCIDQIPSNIECDFTLTCKGDSMIDARIYNGDLVCIRQQPTVENGEIAAVLIDDEVTLKRVQRQNGVLMLIPANSAYTPLVYAGDESKKVRILGKATYFISRVR